MADFFEYKQKDLTTFGNTVNQTFEAFVFASIINWYQENGWRIRFEHPKNYGGKVRLKYSTRGKPENYTYAVAVKRKKQIEIRHNIRIRSAHSDYESPVASFVVDVGVLKVHSAENFSTYDSVENRNLITFSEAKHMSAFAELIGGFIGIVHELLPKRLRRHKTPIGNPIHPHPFLFVSGFSNPSAEGVIATIIERGYRISIIDRDSKDLYGLPLQEIPTKPASIRK